jgi:hypothetical protein
MQPEANDPDPTFLSIEVQSNFDKRDSLEWEKAFKWEVSCAL